MFQFESVEKWLSIWLTLKLLALTCKLKFEIESGPLDRPNYDHILVDLITINVS